MGKIHKIFRAKNKRNRTTEIRVRSKYKRFRDKTT